MPACGAFPIHSLQRLENRDRNILWMYSTPAPKPGLTRDTALRPKPKSKLGPKLPWGTTNNIVRGQLVECLEEECVCDLRNYEVLLRSLRAHRWESFEPVPIVRIALHTVQLQGLTNGTYGHEGLSDILERTSY